jgi:hypothetical protein
VPIQYGLLQQQQQQQQQKGGVRKKEYITIYMDTVRY